MQAYLAAAVSADAGGAFNVAGPQLLEGLRHPEGAATPPLDADAGGPLRLRELRLATTG